MHSDRASWGLKIAAVGGLLFLHLPILLIFLYAFTTEEASYQFPPPVLTLKWFGVAWSRPDIWEALEFTPLGAGDEIQLTDAIAILMKQQSVNAFHITGRSHDCGNKLGYLQAFVEYALRDKQLGGDFSNWLQQLLQLKAN